MNDTYIYIGEIGYIKEMISGKNTRYTPVDVQENIRVTEIIWNRQNTNESNEN